MVTRLPDPHTVPVAIAIVEAPTLVIEWCNEYLYAMAERFTDEEIVGHPIGEFLPIDQAPEIEVAINNCADTGEPAFLEGEVVGPGGVMMQLFASIYRIPDNRLLIVTWHPTLDPVGQSDEPAGTLHPKSVRMGDNAE
jgi:hypothetical protein